MNKVIIIGNLTKAPESSKTNNGIAYSRFTVAVNRDYKDAQGKRECDFLNVIAWRGLSDLSAKYLDKGRKVCVTGQLQVRNYENKDGVKVNTFDIIADEIEFLSASTTQKEKTLNDLKEVQVGAMPF